MSINSFQELQEAQNLFRNHGCDDPKVPAGYFCMELPSGRVAFLRRCLCGSKLPPLFMLDYSKTDFPCYSIKCQSCEISINYPYSMDDAQVNEHWNTRR
jgi:hypothetical protein